MATKKTAAKKAAKTTNQKAAAKRTANKSAAPAAEAGTARGAPVSAAGASTRASADPGTDVGTFGTADLETQKAASVAAQAQYVPNDNNLTPSVGLRLDAVQQAVSERDRLVREGENRRRTHEEVVTQNQSGIMNDLQSSPKAPFDNPLQKPIEPGQTGIHPDVTSPTNAMADEQPRLPGTGVADPRDLAPGQDLSPSPPVSSSNIVPTPLKEGTNFSKV